MGISLSLFNKMGAPGVSSLLSDRIYDKYLKDEKIEKFEDFHTAFIDICKFLNDIMPGKHCDAPTREDIKDFHQKWIAESTEEKKKILFIEFIKEKVKESRSDNQAMILAGVVAPSAAVALKRTGDNIPQVKQFKVHLIPNFIFVPSCTLLALVGVRFMQINKQSKA